MIRFGRDVCGDVVQANKREWLVTNGIGGYAMGTISGALGRRYHGVLIAALTPPVGRSLVVSKLDETVTYDGKTYRLGVDQRGATTYEADGCLYLTSFRLEGTTPVWRYGLADAILEKRLFMAHGENTTYIRYTLVAASRPITLTCAVWVNPRDHHGNTKREALAAVERQVKLLGKGFEVGLEKAGRCVIFCENASPALDFEVIDGVYLQGEADRGFDPLEDHLKIGTFTAALEVGQTLDVILSTEKSFEFDVDAVQTALEKRSQGLIEAAHGATHNAGMTANIAQLVLAADQFIVKRIFRDGSDGFSVIAGYPWFSDWGRDTMIALPGLTLATGRPEIAGLILKTFARYVDQGMLPNTFPETGESVYYNTVDATLWYFEAVRAVVDDTGDLALARELFPVLESIIDWHVKGTRYNIHVDPDDGLLYAGQDDVQLTWMDVKIDDWVVTPRTGKAIEINALWYNALCIMASFADWLRISGTPYRAMARKAQENFDKFWNDDLGCCYDVIDTPDGAPDASVRPNQLIAVSLPHSAFGVLRGRQIVDVCARTLYTSHGMRSLAPDDPRYAPQYVGDGKERDAIYHQGTVWGWLMGAFISAHLKMYGDRDKALGFLQDMIEPLTGGVVGSIAEIFDGDPPHAPKGALAQAWSVSEALRVWWEIEKAKPE